MTQRSSRQPSGHDLDLVEIRKQFPITERYTYLNHAGIGPLSNTARERAAQVISLQGDYGSRGSETWQGLQASARRRVSTLIGAKEHEVCFVKNTPEGISTIASGFPWRAGDNVVVPGCEFPANIYPWLNMRDQGLDVRFVPATNGRFEVADLAAAVDARTRIVAVSWVQFLSGYRVSLADVAEVCRQHGAYLLLDGIQGLGVLPIDVKASGVHFMATASHKWLMAPMGAGWLYCHEDLIDQLRLVEVGQSTVVAGGSYLEYRFEPKPGARRFEPGVPPYASIAGLDGALEEYERIGHERIYRAIQDHCARLIDGLQARRCEIITPLDPERRAGIVSFRHPKRDAGEIETTFFSQGIIVVNREGFVRVSPHFYNTADDIDRFLKALDA